MFIPWVALKHCHSKTSLCAWGAKRNRRRLAEEEAQEGTVTVFWAYDRPMETVSSFKTLGLLLTASKDDWPVVITNICKSRKTWSHLDRIFGWEGADTWTSGNFYIAVVQTILLFG